MASSWRQNVADFGFANSGMKFFARRRDLSRMYIGIGARPDTTRIHLYFAYDPDQLPLDVGPLAPTAAPFPAGYDVEPD